MFEYYATVLKIVDGDTIDVMIDLGLGVHCKERLRFARINAWEMRGEHKEKGKAAKARLAELIPVGKKILVSTQKDKRGKYGRYIAEIYDVDMVPATGTRLNINSILLNEGHAVEYY